MSLRSSLCQETLQQRPATSWPPSLDLRNGGILVAQVFCGLWLLPLGYLVFKSGFLPKVLGILLIVGGCSYLIDCGAQLLVPGFDRTISQFTFVGEVLLPLWLLIRDVNVERWSSVARHSGAEPAIGA